MLTSNHQRSKRGFSETKCQETEHLLDQARMGTIDGESWVNTDDKKETWRVSKIAHVEKGDCLQLQGF